MSDERAAGKLCEDCGEDAVGFDAGPMQWLCAACYRQKPPPSMMVAGTPTDEQVATWKANQESPHEKSE